MAETAILTLVRTVLIPAQSAITTSEEYFKKAGVASLATNFQALFLGLEVPATGVVELAIHELGQGSLNILILRQLGGKAEITLSQFRAFLMTYRKRPEWFVFHLRGRDGNPWAVSTFWIPADVGWYINASSVADSLRWLAGDHVVSRN